MRYIDDIGKEGDYVEHKYNRPRLYRCPACGRKGRRVRVAPHWVPHVGLLNRRSWIYAEVRVYKAQCACCKYFIQQKIVPLDISTEERAYRNRAA
jgi:hypothetical protein